MIKHSNWESRKVNPYYKHWTVKTKNNTKEKLEEGIGWIGLWAESADPCDTCCAAEEKGSREKKQTQWEKKSEPGPTNTYWSNWTTKWLVSFELLGHGPLSFIMQDGSHVRPIVLAGLTAWPNIPSLTPPIPQPNSEVRPAKCNGTRSNSKRLCKLLSKFTDSNLFVKYNSFKNDGLSKTLVYLDSMLKPPNLHFFSLPTPINLLHCFTAAPIHPSPPAVLKPPAIPWGGPKGRGST